TCAACWSRNDSAFEEGGFIAKTSSTGFVEELRRKSRNRKGGFVWPFESGAAAEAVGPARVASIRGGWTSCTSADGIECPWTTSPWYGVRQRQWRPNKRRRKSGSRSSSPKS